ncbi:MAG: MFS transporter, partial [Lachnospiraceae bacterium]|nr:MFS transporter [Lachnospiraceae bacterium]
MEQKNVRKTAGFWGFVWALGLAGQLCWNMENQWFNTFVYEKIAKDPTIISWMVAISATATTISTFVTGTATDRRGRRRLAVSIGYILWGIFTILFGTTEFIMKGAGSGTASVLMTAGVAVVAADAIMSFFGSMGNDSGFNAWMNDHMNERNKGQIGAALATQPIIGTIVGTVAGGMLIGSENNYMRLFVVMGAFVICCGIFSLVFMKDAPDLEPHIEGSFWQQFASVFNFKKYFSLKELVWVNLTLSAYFIAFNMYFTHLGNYMIYYLGFTADMMGFMEGIGLILAMLLVFPATKLINAGRHVPIAFASIFFNIAGLLVLGFFVRPENVNTGSIFNPVMLIGVFLIGVGYV